MINKFEGEPNLNSSESNLNETGTDINAEKLEVEGSEKQEIKQPELLPEEQLKNLEDGIGTKGQEITKLTESIEGTKSELDEARGELGLPPMEDEPPNTASDKEKLEKLQAERDALEKQKEELVSQQEKGNLIKEEKEKILQEKLDELFKEFEGFNPGDLKSILNKGKTKEGKNVESNSMGELDPEVAKSLAKAFEEGIKLLPEIIKNLPELFKKFDEDLTKEAMERVDKKLEEQKKEEKPEESRPEEKSETIEDKIPPVGEIKKESNFIEGMPIENPKG